MSRSVMQHNFAEIPSITGGNRSIFNESHGLKTAFSEDYLIPILVEEVLPGDSFKVRTHVFARLATPIVPIMDNIFIDQFYFFVPCRLVWDNWTKFMGPDPNDEVIHTIPQVIADEVSGGVPKGFAVESIYDYMGLPIEVYGQTQSSLPLRAYNLIFNEWFRDQWLIEEATVLKDDGPDPRITYALLKRAKLRDYFTSCLPAPQKGPGVSIPIGDTAPVFGNGLALGLHGNITTGLRSSNTSYLLEASSTAIGKTTGASDTSGTQMSDHIAVGVFAKPASTSDYPKSGLYADLSAATAASINSLRQAFQLQKMQERDARGGSRYTEIIMAHFQVRNPDFRLQRPEYLGGSSQRISINPVQKTSSTDVTSPQGHLAAYGTAADSSAHFSKSFTEHGFIIGLANVRADITYQRGLRRMWSRLTRNDFYWIEYSHLGEQAVLNKEIFSQGPLVTNPQHDIYDDLVFGYQERFAEYRHHPSAITGKLRSNPITATPQYGSLDVWHFSQNYQNLPQLDTDFINSNTTSRYCAVPSEPHVIADFYFDSIYARKMPVFGDPGQIDHF